MRPYLGALAVVWGDARNYLHSAMIRARWAGQGVRVAPGAVIKARGRVLIETGVSVGRDAVIVAGAADALIEIGRGTKVNQRCFLTAKRHIKIGRHVLFSNNVFICDHLHAFEDVDTPVIQQGAGEPQPVEVGDGTWIGINVAIMPGVRIGRQCVIGANSVVTRDLPDFAIAVGAPARVVRSLASAEA